MVEVMRMLRHVMRVPYGVLCGVMDFAYSTFMRWKVRLQRGEVLVRGRGPKKVGALALEAFRSDFRSLRHGRCRSRGVALLRARYEEALSRREVAALVHKGRTLANRARRAHLKRVVWPYPGTVWSMDDTEYGPDTQGRKLYVHTPKDVPSGYFLDPLGGSFAKEEDVAENLKGLFAKYGPPLFLKEDNAGNLSHKAVLDVLKAHWVIPLFSPCDYPQYNGAAEQGQGELKAALRAQIGFPAPPRRESFPAHLAQAVHMLNHKPLRRLKGSSRCHYFFSRKSEKRFTKRQRKSIFAWIRNLFYVILKALGERSRRAAQTAWRVAVETWLERNGLIQVFRPENVSPNSLVTLSHN